jgi:hypothetical protein
MGDFIGFAVDGLPKLQKILDGLSEEIQDEAVEEVNREFLKVLTKYEHQQNYVTRARAYGVTFFTEKQRRWFFANLREGNIDVPYHRTHALRAAWRQEGTGRRSFIINDAEGAPFVMGDDTQSRHEKMVGWKTISVIVRENTDRAVKNLGKVVDRILRRRGAT